jgi:tetratricopeptide (TPR) repeat protein
VTTSLQSKFDQALALHREGNLSDAERAYRKILQQRPNHADALHFLGVISVQTQRAEQGIELIKKSISFTPKNSPVHNSLGNALRSLNRHEEALASYDRAIELRRDYAAAYFNRGNALRDLKRLEEALKSYDTAFALKMDDAVAHYNHGNTLLELDRPEEAIASFDKAIARKTDYAEAYNNRGAALRDLKRSEEAIASFDRAIALKSDDAVAYYNRGNALLDLKRPGEALLTFDKAIALKSDYADAYNSKAAALQNLKDPESALEIYGKAIDLRPNNAAACWNQSLCFLQLGRFEQGWRQYEWRKKLDPPIAARDFPKPLWLGREDIASKIVFVHCEQGLGDTLQFCRYLKLLEARGAMAIISVQQPLHRLLQQLGPAIRVINQDEIPSDFDYHCPLLSLPLALGTTLETIPAEQQYLRADEGRQSDWSARFPSGRPRIGVVWSGSQTHKNDHNRSIGLKRFLPICDLDANWICLQKEIPEEDAFALEQFRRIAVYNQHLRDFSDTAALIDQMDLIITIDTSVAHLAGALGKPVWILLPFNPDWRWMLDRQDSPWYPSARLFRQQRIDDWEGVIDRIKSELQCFLT